MWGRFEPGHETKGCRPVTVFVPPRAPTGRPIAIDIHDKPQTTAYRFYVLQ